MLGSCETSQDNASAEVESDKTLHISSVDPSLHHTRYNVRSRYEFVKTLGKGTYGKVKLAIERDTGRKFAVKSIRKDRIKGKKDMKHIRREMKIMSSLHHPNIIQIHEVFENQDKIVIVMEYAPGGELYDHLANKMITSEEESRVFFKQIVSAVQYCHKLGVVHRDLKLENILLGENFQIKIADFGLANIFESGQLLETFCGSPLYASPEIVNGIPYVGPEVDSWSMGVLLYALVYGMMPFDGSDYKTLTRQISHGKYSRQTKYPDAADLIGRMLVVDSSSRANIDEIANHHWLKQSPPPRTAVSPVMVHQILDNNANHIDPHKQLYPLGVPLPPSFSPTIANYAAVAVTPSPPPKSPIQQIGTTVLTPCAMENCAHSNCPMAFTQPKGILKRINGHTNSVVQPIAGNNTLAPLQPTWSPQYANPVQQTHPNGVAAFNKDVACGLQAKDSLKLKAKPLGASGKRRVLRSKRDRESGYYSSPERTPVETQSVQVSAPVFTFAQPVIKPQLTTNISQDCFKTRQHPQQPDNFVTNQFCGLPYGYVMPVTNVNQTMPIIEGQTMSYYPHVPITLNGTVEQGIHANVLPYTITTLNDESQTRGKRPISTYSDSSILSSDSFELCTFESPLSTAPGVLPTGAYTTADAAMVNLVHPTAAYRTEVTRPSSLPMSIPHSDGGGRCSPIPSGALTPTSAKLNHDLRQILAPNRPRRRHTKSNEEPVQHNSYTANMGDEQAQLEEMMRQLSLDLERACKKGIDMKVSLTASAEV
ncbi:NUAK family SNF1-like kinase 1 [Styela clava]